MAEGSCETSLDASLSSSWCAAHAGTGGLTCCVTGCLLAYWLRSGWVPCLYHPDGRYDVSVVGELERLQTVTSAPYSSLYNKHKPEINRSGVIVIILYFILQTLWFIVSE